MIERDGRHRGYVGVDGHLRPLIFDGIDGVDMGVLCRSRVGNWDFVEGVVKRVVERAASCEHLEGLLREMRDLKFLCSR